MTAEASCLLFKWKVYIFNHLTRVELLALLEPRQARSPDIGKARLHLFKGNFQTVLCRVLVAMLNPGKTSPSERDTHYQQSLLSEITWTPIFSLAFIKKVDHCYSSTQPSTGIPLRQLLPRNAEIEGTSACPPKNSQYSSNPKKYVLSRSQIRNCPPVATNLRILVPCDYAQRIKWGRFHANRFWSCISLGFQKGSF